jgi:hypothetical protein
MSGWCCRRASNQTKSTMSARRAVFQISARAFVSPRCAGGGNPVTIFVPSSSNNGSSATLSPEFRSRLAQTCAWESVVVEPYEEDTSSTLVVLPQFSFFMPSGEEVSFCAREFRNILFAFYRYNHFYNHSWTLIHLPMNKLKCK